MLGIDAVAIPLLFTFGLLTALRVTLNVDLGSLNSLQDLAPISSPFNLPLFLACFILGVDLLSIDRARRWNKLIIDDEQNEN
jgi:hypothetical protein